jgi:16S rRNA U1498 N3-methylase RsmE
MQDITRKERTAMRNDAIYKEYNHLYEVKRLRYDDTIKVLAMDFYLSPRIIERILTQCHSAKTEKVKATD